MMELKGIERASDSRKSNATLKEWEEEVRKKVHSLFHRLTKC